MNISEIKREAKDALRGKWILLLVVLLVVSAIGSATIGIILPVLAFGSYLITVDILNGRDIDVNRFVEPFTNLNQALKLIVINLIYGVLIMLGTFLFIVPGFIIALMYSQAAYIMMDNPDMTISEALSTSAAMMKGKKMNLFVFYLSFIGHFFLIIITFGIYSIYLIPLVQAANVNYYLHLKRDNLDFIEA